MPRFLLCSSAVLVLAFSLLYLLTSNTSVLKWPATSIGSETGSSNTHIGVGRPHRVLRTSRRDNSFTIAILADLHYGEEEHGWGIKQDVKSTAVIESVLDYEPEVGLVVINGDLITGENTFRENSSAYVDRVVAPMVQRSVPWASTYG